MCRMYVRNVQKPSYNFNTYFAFYNIKIINTIIISNDQYSLNYGQLQVNFAPFYRLNNKKIFDVVKYQ